MSNVYLSHFWWFNVGVLHETLTEKWIFPIKWEPVVLDKRKVLIKHNDMNNKWDIFRLVPLILQIDNRKVLIVMDDVFLIKTRIPVYHVHPQIFSGIILLIKDKKLFSDLAKHVIEKCWYV